MKKYSVQISGHASSISLEPEFWAVLRATAKTRKISINQLVSEIDEQRTQGNLSSALRVFVLKEAIESSHREDF